MGGLPPGFDPSQLDPAWMAQVTQAVQRLPRGQMQRLQAVMQKAMAGKDVTREAADLERLLPPDFKNLMSSFQMPGSAGAAPVESPTAEMTPDDARKIVESAVAEGKLSPEQAQALLHAEAGQEGAPEGSASKKGGIAGLWKKVTGK